MHDPELNNPLEVQNTAEDTIKTANLLASEVAGSWACSTAPSVQGENKSSRSRDNDYRGDAALPDSNVQVTESQSKPSSEANAAVRRCQERQALSEMIGIVAPDLREQFGVAVGDDCDREGPRKGFTSNSDTEDCTDNDENTGVNDIGESISDAETEGSEQKDAVMDEDDEATQEDSIG